MAGLFRWSTECRTRASFDDGSRDDWGAGRAGAPCRDRERDQPFVCAHPTKVERAQRKLTTRISYDPAVGARKSTISLVLSKLDEKNDPLGPRTSRSRSALGRLAWSTADGSAVQEIAARSR